MLTLPEIFDLIPQQTPFRFIDRLVEVDENHAVGEYTYRPDESFFAGHFPCYPVTPGVILVETMGQTFGAMFIYLLGLQTDADGIRKLGALVTEMNIEFTEAVLPGQTVRVRAEKVFWRARKLKGRVELAVVDGATVAQGTLGAVVFDLPASW